MLGVLMALVVGCTPKSDSVSELTPEPDPSPELTPTPELPQEPIATEEPDPSPDSEASTPVPQASNAYVSDAYGFSFTYPSRYVMPEENYIESYAAGESVAPQQTLELWPQQAHDNIQERLDEATELPPNIIVQVFENTDQTPLKAWKPELSSVDNRALTVDGQAAIAFASTGLYEHDNVLVSTPDGKYVLRFSVGYFDANDPMRQDFQDIVSSLEFR